MWVHSCTMTLVWQCSRCYSRRVGGQEVEVVCQCRTPLSESCLASTWRRKRELRSDDCGTAEYIVNQDQWLLSWWVQWQTVRSIKYSAHCSQSETQMSANHDIDEGTGRRTCHCQRVFHHENAFNTHLRVCRKSRKQLVDGLTRAKQLWEEKKQLRKASLENLVVCSSTSCLIYSLHSLVVGFYLPCPDYGAISRKSFNPSSPAWRRCSRRFRCSRSKSETYAWKEAS